MTLAIVEPPANQWDEFVQSHAHGNLFQLSAWARLKTAFGWHSQRIAVARMQHHPDGHASAARTHHTLCAGGQLLFRKRYGVSVAYLPRGPLFATDPIANNLLITLLRRVALRHRAVFLRLEPPILDDHTPTTNALHSWLLGAGFQPTDPIQPRSTILVTLPPQHTPNDTHQTNAIHSLHTTFRKGHRADIRRAERAGVVVRVSSPASNHHDITAFYAMMKTTSSRASFGIHSCAYYQQAWQLLQPHSHLLLAELQGEVIAAHMVFADATTGYYLYSGANEQGLQSGANHLLQWHALQWAHAQGCHTYDFWGIPDALGKAETAATDDERTRLTAAAQHDPLIGVYRFKKGFGGTIARYLPAYDQVYISPLYTLWHRRLQS